MTDLSIRCKPQCSLTNPTCSKMCNLMFTLKILIKSKISPDISANNNHAKYILMKSPEAVYLAESACCSCQHLRPS